MTRIIIIIAITIKMTALTIIKATNQLHMKHVKEPY